MEILIIDKKEVDKLKQQLAEKDKEIERLNHKLNVECSCLIRNYKDMLEQLIQLQIQLVIAELEKVKVELKEKIKIMNNEEHCYPQKFVKWIDFCDQLNKQIKELKGEK